ncbi:hypothetical protein CD351_12100 [Erythrobacter sp. KY5]|nr:hypothetical protein CD351_12100 [Erythrobacter sp. KY5]
MRAQNRLIRLPPSRYFGRAGRVVPNRPSIKMRRPATIMRMLIRIPTRLPPGIRATGRKGLRGIVGRGFHRAVLLWRGKDQGIWQVLGV